LSLIAGFSVLQLSSFVPIQLFGELICVTVFGCLLSTLLVLPAMIALVWPKEPAVVRRRHSDFARGSASK
jgi:uncharacterized protein